MPQQNQAAMPKVAMDFPFAEMFPTPYHLVCFYDEAIRERHINPITGKPYEIHDWQKECLIELGRTRGNGEAIRAMLLAANGSGKSQYVLAPFAIWMALVFKESLTVITTASGEQLDTQALRYITRLGNQVNQAHFPTFGFDVFDLKYREVRGNITKSFIDLFATDEPGKAEGRHPLRPGAEFALIIDEAKTVDDEIYKALERCKGASRRIEISSADDCQGYFYKTWHNEKYLCFRKKVTAFDCPHITKHEIDETIAKYGIDSPFVRASIYSEFVSVQESVVLSRETLIRCNRLASCATPFGPLVAGLDLSAGGDESVLSVWNGNMEVGRHVFPIDPYTPNTARAVIAAVNEYRGKLLWQNINADDGGVGRGIIDQIIEMVDPKKEGLCPVRRVLNNSRAYDFTHYTNHGTELWHNFKRFVEMAQVHFLLDSSGNMDERTMSQLTHRYTKKIDNTSTVQLESKAVARKNGHPSPDRADAIVLAWRGRVYPLPEISGIAKAEKITLNEKDRMRLIEERLRSKVVGDYESSKMVNDNIANGKYKTTGRFTFKHSAIHPPHGGNTISKQYARRRFN